MPATDGQLQRHGEKWELRFTRRLRHAPEKVFAALSEPEHLRAWFPFDIEGERAPGASLRFVFRDDEAPPFEGEMVAYEPPSVMELRWGGDETLRLEVAPDGDGSVLTLINVFADLGKAARDAAGWHACLDALEAHVEGQPAPENRWAEVHPQYVERFGPEAATIGPPEPA